MEKLNTLNLLNDGHSLPCISEVLCIENTSTDLINLYELVNDKATPSTANTVMAAVWDEYIKSNMEAVVISILRDFTRRTAAKASVALKVFEIMYQPILPLTHKTSKATRE